MKKQFEELVEKYSNNIRDYVNSLEEINLQLEATIEELKNENNKLKKEQSPISLENGVLLSYKQLSNIINTLATAETPEAKELAEYLIQFGNKTFNLQKANSQKETIKKDEFLPEDIIKKINENTAKNEQAILNKKNDFDLFFNNPCHKAFDNILTDFIKATPSNNPNKKGSIKKDLPKETLNENDSNKIKLTNLNPNQKLYYTEKNPLKPKEEQFDMNDAEQISKLFNDFFVKHPQEYSFVDLINSILKAKNHSDYNQWK
jgi:hypothetical protein